MTTFFYRSLAKAAGLTEVNPGQEINVRVDLILAHDGTCPKLLKVWESGNTMVDGTRVLVTVDHAFPAPTPQDRAFQKQLAEFAGTHGCTLYNQGEGVLHQVVAEKVSLRPGMIIAGADGHVATSGAYGALAFALTPEDLIPVLTTGLLTLKVAEVFAIELQGSLKQGTLARDVALYIIGKLGQEIRSKAVALTGSFLTELSPADRMTICNLLPEAGVVTAFVVPEGEEPGPVGKCIEVDDIEPMIAVPPEPTLVKPVKDLAGTAITVAIAGGCSAGRLQDMEVIAEVLADKPVHPNVTFIVTPASRQVAKEMDEKGISALLRERGAIILPPGCGPCPGKHFGVLAPGDIAVTTTVRNTPGRIGSTEAEIYLASPLTVARSAIKGQI